MNIFASLTKLNIGPRLLVGFGVLLALTLLVGAASLYAEQLRTQEEERVIGAAQEVLQSESIQLQVSEARRLEQSFLLRREAEGFDAAFQNYIIPNQQAMTDVRELVEEFIEEEGEGGDEDQEFDTEALTAIEEATHTYDTAFASLVDNLELRGDQTAGFEGAVLGGFELLDMRVEALGLAEVDDALHELEDSVLRFLLTGDVAYITSFDQDLIALRDTIPQSAALSASQAAEIDDLINDVELNFDQLVQVDVQNALLQAEFETAAAGIIPLAQELIADARVEEETAQDDFEATGRVIFAIQVSLLALATITGLTLAFIIRRSIVRPLVILADAVNRFREGDLQARAYLGTSDEIGGFANTFNDMADELQDMVDSLEARVTARTEDLARAVEVGSVVTRIYSQQEMLPNVADFIRENFGLYYTQVYTLDEAKRYANLRAGTGEVGQQLLERQHRLDMAQTSLVAQAVHSAAPVLVEDTEQNTLHRKNPLLPNTRSELAVPLIVGGDILGVLDMQSEAPGTFNEENVTVFEAMASQLAASLKGAQAYDLAQESIQRAEAITQRLTGQKWQSYLGRLGAGERVGYQYDLESPKPLTGAVVDGKGSNGDHQNYVSMPIEVHGRQIGVLKAEDDTLRVWTDEELALVRGISEHVARAVEQFRAFDETEKRAAELHTVAQVSAAASRIQTLEELLPRVANLTRESFDLYHAHIYLLDEIGMVLELAAGAGEVGVTMVNQGHSIDLHNPKSLVARAARTSEGVIENDVQKSPDFLPNPLLPLTRAEMAIPMIIGETLIGVLDVQSKSVNRFTEEDVLIKTTLADQIAVAVQNARTFETERDAAERLREVDRLKSQFLANMSHELRTPLNSIIGYAEVLLDGIDGDLSSEATLDVEDIHSSGKHLLAIINDILDLAKIEAGQMKMDAQQLPLQDMVDDVVHTAQILVKEKAVSLQVIAEPDPILVEADPIRLRQVVLNLVSNAVKFTESGSVTIEIARSSGNEAVVKVIDTGIGMSEEGLAVIFERFSQVDGSPTRRSDGTGLGLTITRELVQLHGGDIYADSVEGQGSTFWFTIPIVQHEMIGK